MLLILGRLSSGGRTRGGPLRPRSRAARSLRGPDL